MDETRRAQPKAQSMQSEPPPPGTPVFVDVYADTAPNGCIEWSHKWRYRNHSPRDGSIVIPKKEKGQPGTPIHFQLHNRTQPRIGLSFVDCDDAIWVSRTSCPQSRASDPEITRIEPSGMVLKVLDLNKEDCTLHYTLRFEPEPTRYCYDPEIRNGGSTVA